MFCFKGCSREIDALRAELQELVEENHSLFKRLEIEKKVLATHLELSHKEYKRLEEEYIILESKLLKCAEGKQKAADGIKEEVKGVGTYYNDPVSGEPLFKSVDEDSKKTARKKK